MVVEEEVMNGFWSRKTLMKKQCLSSTLRSRSKLVESYAGLAFMYRYKTGEGTSSGTVVYLSRVRCGYVC